MSDKPREFQPIESAAEREKILLEAIKVVASTFVWARHQQVTLSSHLVCLDSVLEELRVAVPSGVDGERFSRTLDEIGDRECFFSVSLTRMVVFFRAKLIEVDGRELRFARPHEIFRVQRRKDLRTPIVDSGALGMQLTPTGTREPLSLRVVDLSAGGAGVILDSPPPLEAKLLESGARLGSVSFELLGRRIGCEVEVRYARRLESQLRLGLQFRGMLRADQQVISAYAFEQSRRYYAKFID